MQYLNPIEMNGTTFRDIRKFEGRMNEAQRLKWARKLREEKDKLYDFMRSQSGVEPGCGSLRSSVAREEFENSEQALSGDRDFKKWRAEQEEARVCVDPQTPESFIWAASDRSGLKGAILMYSLEVVGINNGVVGYTAYCGPFMDPGIATDFMLYLLDNQATGFRADRSPLTTQLLGWKFPVEDERNRWLTSRPNATMWVPKFNAAHDLELETRGSQQFAKSLRKLP